MMLNLLQASSQADAWIRDLQKASAEEVLLRVLLQLGTIILSARLFAVLFHRIGQPGVVGEIAAGLLLGPSVLGRFCPSVFDAIFRPPVTGLAPEAANALLGWILTTLAQLGLVFLLFLVGMEFDFSHLRWHGKSALAISVSGVALPFVLGTGLALLMLPYIEQDTPPLGFTLFLGTALSITAIPVLGRIMMELGITRTRLGTLTISAAAVDDAAGWILLATVAAVVRSNFNPGQAVFMVAATAIFGLFMVFVAKPLLCTWARHALRRSDGEISLSALTMLFALIFACAIITSLIGIFAVFGAFLLGAIFSGEHEFRDAVSRRLRDFVTGLFLPIFFTFTGLRTDIDSLSSSSSWLLCGVVLAAAFAGKCGGCGLAAWLGGLTRREAACVGTMMNCRGLMELIVVNLGYELGVIPRSVFCMLVLMAVVTTFMTTPLLLWLMPGTELEPYILRSGFLRGRIHSVRA